MNAGRLLVSLVCALGTRAACDVEVAASRRDEVRVYPTSKRPRERQVLPGEWMLVSSQYGLWMPQVFEGERSLTFRKRGPELSVEREGGAGEVVGVRLGSFTGRVELRSALAGDAKRLTIWCYGSGVAELPTLPAGRYYALAVEGASDFKELARFPQLSALRVVCSKGVADLAPLAALTGLESLWVSGATASDLTPLAGLKRLKVLRLDDARGVADLAPLAQLADLRLLELDGAEKLTDLSPLAGLPRLSVLVLRRCANVRDLAPLAACRELTWLGVHGSPLVRDLTPLKGLAQLSTVELAGCPSLRDLAPLACVAGLEAVSLQSCPELADLAPLECLSKLSRLELLDCPRVADLWPLRKAAQQPHKFSVDCRLRGHLDAVEQAAPDKVTVLVNGRFAASVAAAPDAPAAGGGLVNILGRGTAVPPSAGLKCDQVPYPVAGHKPGSVLDFSFDGPRVYQSRDQAPRQLVGVIACSPVGFTALAEAVAAGASPLIIWSDAASLERLPALPAGRDYTLVLLGLKAPLEPLARVKNLAGLYITHGGAEASNGSPIAHLTGLKTLVIRGTPRLTSLRCVARMTQLATLEVALAPMVSDLRPLAKLTGLNAVRLTSGRQLDFAPLAALPNLTELTLDGRRLPTAAHVAAGSPAQSSNQPL